MKRIIALTAAFLTLFIATSLAETTIKAEVDKAKISTDEALTYKLVIASSEKKLPAPQLPKFEGFVVVSQAQSNTVSFTGGEIKNIVVFAYILAPTATGKFKIGPSEIKVQDKTYSSEVFEIEVTQGKRSPKVPPQKPAVPIPGQPGQEEPQYTL